MTRCHGHGADMRSGAKRVEDAGDGFRDTVSQRGSRRAAGGRQVEEPEVGSRDTVSQPGRRESLAVNGPRGPKSG